LSDAYVIAKIALQGEGRYMQKDDFTFTKSVCRAASNYPRWKDLYRKWKSG